MRIKFWGARGSVPSPLVSEDVQYKIKKILTRAIQKNIDSLEKIDGFLDSLSDFSYGTVGGNTSCIEVDADDKIFIFDMGSGLRNFGQHLQDTNNFKNQTFYIFLTHTHWDHISGFPFFYPAFFPQNKLILHSTIPDFKERLEIQQDSKFFPVSMDSMHSEKEFVKLEYSSSIKYNDAEVSNLRLHHPGGSFAYRLSCKGKTFVYATDSEFRNLSDTFILNFSNFCHQADALVIDAQYTFEEAAQKEDWGHSSALAGINIAADAGVKRIFLFHHDPNRNDEDLNAVYKKAANYHRMNYPQSDLEIYLAREGMEIKI